MQTGGATVTLPELDGHPEAVVRDQLQLRHLEIDVPAPGTFISTVIPLAVFFACQRQFVSGVMAGAVK
jgi:alpha-glucoside transport system permease protein